jgi:formate dehydrogenase subunit delta
MDTGDKLVMMANQIAAAFAAQGEARAVPAIADHIQKFWDPVMRGKFLALSEHAKLHPFLRSALPLIH